MTVEEMIAELSKEGLEVKTIAARVNRSTSAVVRARTRLGLSAFLVKRFTDDERAVILRFLEDGASYNEVARSVGRSVGVVARSFPGFGWSIDDQISYARCRRMFKELAQFGDYKKNGYVND